MHASRHLLTIQSSAESSPNCSAELRAHSPVPANPPLISLCCRGASATLGLLPAGGCCGASVREKTRQESKKSTRTPSCKRQQLAAKMLFPAPSSSWLSPAGEEAACCGYPRRRGGTGSRHGPAVAQSPAQNVLSFPSANVVAPDGSRQAFSVI